MSEDMTGTTIREKALKFSRDLDQLIIDIEQFQAKLVDVSDGLRLLQYGLMRLSIMEEIHKDAETDEKP